MKIGYAQFEPVLGDLEATIGSLDRLMAGAEGADLLVLPELANSGYNFESHQQAVASAESLDDSPFLRFLQERCRRLDIHLVAGMNEREGDILFNTAVLVGPEGLVGKYRKLHLFVDEKDHFAPGNLGLPVFEVGDCRVGMLICFDWMFPEVWRILALKGADVICHPSNLVIPRLAQPAVPVHALTNRVYVVTANRIGVESNLTFTGLSTIADPGGRILAQGPQAGEEVEFVTADPALARDKMITGRNHVFNDRRPDEYTGLVGL